MDVAFGARLTFPDVEPFKVSEDALMMLGTCEIAGAAALRVAEMLCVAPVIVIVDVKQTGPVPPAGRIVPAPEQTVNFHGRFGAIAVELTRLNEKEPAALRFAGPELMLKPSPFKVGVTPAVTTCAEIVPSAYGVPFGSVTVPDTSVNCAAAKLENFSANRSNRNARNDIVRIGITIPSSAPETKTQPRRRELITAFALDPEAPRPSR